MMLLGVSRITNVVVQRQGKGIGLADMVVRMEFETNGALANIKAARLFDLTDDQTETEFRNQLLNIGLKKLKSGTALVKQLQALEGKTVVVRYYPREDDDYRPYMTGHPVENLRMIKLLQDGVAQDMPLEEKQLCELARDKYWVDSKAPQFAQKGVTDDNERVWLVLFVPLEDGDSCAGTYVLDAVSREEAKPKDGDAVWTWEADGGYEADHRVELSDGTTIHFYPDDELTDGHYLIEFGGGNGAGFMASSLSAIDGGGLVDG